MKVTVTISDDVIRAYIGEALQRGSENGLVVEKQQIPKQWILGTRQHQLTEDIPLSPGGYLIIKDHFNPHLPPKKLDLHSIKLGLERMAAQRPGLFAACMQHKNLEIADEFLYCLLF